LIDTNRHASPAVRAVLTLHESDVELLASVRSNLIPCFNSVLPSLEPPAHTFRALESCWHAGEGLPCCPVTSRGSSGAAKGRAGEEYQVRARYQVRANPLLLLQIHSNRHAPPAVRTVLAVHGSDVELLILQIRFVFCPVGSAMWPQCWLCAVYAVGHVGCCVGGGGVPCGGKHIIINTYTSARTARRRSSSGST